MAVIQELRVRHFLLPFRYFGVILQFFICFFKGGGSIGGGGSIPIAIFSPCQFLYNSTFEVHAYKW